MEPEPQQPETWEEAQRIVRHAERSKITLRLIGGLAVRFHCHGEHAAHLRKYHDIDLFGLKKQSEGIFSVLEGLGYLPNSRYNSLYGEFRLQFIKQETSPVDVLLDKFVMDHTLDFRKRLFLDDLTVPITDLLLTKLQIVKLTENDVRDMVAILEDHEIGHSDDKEILNVDYAADVCSHDWGLQRSVSENLDKMRELLGEIVADPGPKTHLFRKIDLIQNALLRSTKSISWRIRSLIGDRVKWYQEVEVGEAEAC